MASIPAAIAGALLLGSQMVHAQTLGTISFPTTASKQAQPHFLEGVKDLHSFAFDEAAAAFQAAEKADPGFALAYWGEAMSHNHPLWSQQDLPAARAVLAKLGPTPEARLTKAGNDKERAYIEAQEILFNAPGDKLARDVAYSEAMASMHARWPGDDEVSIFYSLSLLGAVRPGDTGFRRQALAASIALPIFQKNPDHPGAAHFIIHAFDDPDHAVLALPAARVYARIAPDAPHALHMPSHIFVQLGLWEDVRRSNTAAYASAEAVVRKYHSPEGGEDFHTLSWLQYSDLMLHRFDEAQQALGNARAALARNPNSDAVRNGYLTMWARQILETESWTALPLEPDGLKPNGPWLFVAGYSAARRKDFETAGKAAAELKRLAAEAGAGDTAYTARPLAIMEKEVESEAAFEQGHNDDALALAREASDIELTLRAPSGPPQPIKPATEHLAQILVRTGSRAEAAAAFRQQLLRTPNRTPAVRELTALGPVPQPHEAAAGGASHVH